MAELAFARWPLAQPLDILDAKAFGFGVGVAFFIAGVGSQTLPLFILAMMRRGIRPQITALAVLILLFSFVVATVGLLLRNRKP